MCPVSLARREESVMLDCDIHVSHLSIYENTTLAQKGEWRPRPLRLAEISLELEDMTGTARSTGTRMLSEMCEWEVCALQVLLMCIGYASSIPEFAFYAKPGEGDQQVPSSSVKCFAMVTYGVLKLIQFIQDMYDVRPDVSAANVVALEIT